jgi:membrane protease YdiL (CAAX protease family)
MIAGGMVGLYWVAGDWLLDVPRLRAVVAGSGLDRPSVYVAGACYWITVNSVLEEYVFRWFMFRQFAARVPNGAAVCAAALAFTVHHTVALQLQFGWPMAVLGSAGVFVGAAIWSWLYARCGSIWPGYVSHAIVDIAIFSLGALMVFGGLPEPI